MALDRPKVPNDLSAFWMPFTANRQFKKAPRLLAGAKDMHYQTVDGREILDGTAGLWCCNAGHCRPRITEAIQQQAAELDYAPAFQMGHPRAFELASALRDIAPEGMEHVFFTNSGSESVETALKIALAYHRARGEGHRTRLVGREKGYHGVNFGGISVGGITNNKRMFPSLPNVTHLPATHLKENAFSRGQPEHGADLADELERQAAIYGGETIAACIVEPVAGSAGVILPPKGYLERLRSICDQHGILLIFDEVITGFGRTGNLFAAETYGMTPDIMTIAKGLSSGYAPIGGSIVADHVAEAINGAGDFNHGYTYSGHPVACAVALENLRIMIEEKMVERVREDTGPYLAERWSALVDHPLVGEAKIKGMMASIALTPDKARRAKFAAEVGTVGLRARDRSFANNLVMRHVGDRMIIAPPLIISKSEIDTLIERAWKALDETYAGLKDDGLLVAG